jgi:hypothetical protein
MRSSTAKRRAEELEKQIEQVLTEVRDLGRVRGRRTGGWRWSRMHALQERYSALSIQYRELVG